MRRFAADQVEHAVVQYSPAAWQLEDLRDGARTRSRFRHASLTLSDQPSTPPVAANQAEDCGGVGDAMRDLPRAHQPKLKNTTVMLMADTHMPIVSEALRVITGGVEASTSPHGASVPITHKAPEYGSSATPMSGRIAIRSFSVAPASAIAVAIPRI